jgi:hypothetical protein
MHHNRTAMLRQSRRFRRRSRMVEEDRRPQPDVSTPEENRQLLANTFVGEEECQPLAKPSTSGEDRRPVVQETVDLCGTQTQTQEAHTRTHARARVEFTSLNTHQLPKKEIHEKSEDELREHGLRKCLVLIPYGNGGANRESMRRDAASMMNASELAGRPS